MTCQEEKAICDLIENGQYAFVQTLLKRKEFDGVRKHFYKYHLYIKKLKNLAVKTIVKDWYINVLEKITQDIFKAAYNIHVAYEGMKTTSHLIIRVPKTLEGGINNGFYMNLNTLPYPNYRFALIASFVPKNTFLQPIMNITEKEYLEIKEIWNEYKMNSMGHSVKWEIWVRNKELIDSLIFGQSNKVSAMLNDRNGFPNNIFPTKSPYPNMTNLEWIEYNLNFLVFISCVKE